MRLWRTALLIALANVPVAAHALVVCADPNNLPFSNQREQGFENHLAQLIARHLNTTVRYEWWAQRRGFARQTLAQSRCDIWPGVATGVQGMATSAPYYRSTYVFVTRRAAGLQGLTLDDPRLRTNIVGVQLVGDDGMNTPPAGALAARGITGNVRGFTLYGDYRRPDPPSAILDAVAHNAIEVALVWGPLAGYYAEHSTVPLRLEPIAEEGGASQPMSYSISVGVRRGNAELLAQINETLRSQAPAIKALLHRYGVPLLGAP